MNDNDILNLLELNENELYLLLGNKLNLTILALNPEEKDEGIRQLAKEWYNSQKKSIKKQLCNSKTLETILSHKTRISIIRAISDIIAHHFLGFPPIEISVIIFREGLNNICNEK